MSWKNTIVKAKTFLYSSLSGLKISLGGQLGVNEILALTNSLRWKEWKEMYRNVPDIKRINIAYLVFFIAQVVSDFVNQSATSDLIRGWANIIVAMIVTNFLVKMFWKRNDAIIYYFFGVILGSILFGPETEGVDLEDMGFFKFKLVPILNASMMLMAIFFIKKSDRARWGIIGLFVIYGLFNVAFDSRSNGTIFLFIAFLLYKKDVFQRFSFKKMLPYIVIVAIVGQTIYSYYVSQVLAGKLGGLHARQQFEQAGNPYNPISLLMAGRAEVYVAMVAIKDKPIFGHGSWAPDPGGKYTFITYRLHGEEDRFDNFLATGVTPIIPSHSVLFGAWLTAGLGGIAAMGYIMFLFYKRIRLLIRTKLVRESPYFPLVLWYSISPFWTFLFSPLPHIKQTLPVVLAFIIVLSRKIELRKLYAAHKLKQENDEEKIEAVPQQFVGA